MSITWRIVVKICLNPCHAPGIVAAALYRGQGTAAAAIRPTTIKLDQEHSHQISIGGPPSSSHHTVLDNVAKISCREIVVTRPPLLINCVLINLNRMLKICTKRAVMKSASGSICKPQQYRGGPVSGQWWCHYVTLKLPVHSVHLSGSIVGSSYWIITPNFADNPFARIVQHTVHDKAGSGATPQYPD